MKINMEIDKWIGLCKVRGFHWNEELYYLHVKGYEPGQSINQPAWEKTVYITENTAGERLLKYFLDSLINYISELDIPKGAAKIVITA